MFSVRGLSGEKRTRRSFLQARQRLKRTRGRRRAAIPMVVSTSLAALSNVRTGGFTGIERKFFDTDNVSAFNTSWAIEENVTTALSAVAQGDGESNRDGRIYNILSIHIRGHIIVGVAESQTAPIGDQLCRLALVWDKQSNGANITATDVYDAGPTDDINSFRNLQFTKRFHVLKDKTWLVRRQGLNEGAANLFAAVNRKIPFKWNFTFKVPIRVTMSGTTADIANVTDNSLHMIGVSTSTLVTYSYASRIRFTG